MYETLEVAPELMPFINRYIFADAKAKLNATVRPPPSGFSYFGHLFHGTLSNTIRGVSRAVGPGFYFTNQSTHEDVAIHYRDSFGYVSAELHPTAIYRLFGVPMGNQDKVLLESAELLGVERAAALGAFNVGAASKSEHKKAFDAMFLSLMGTALPEVPKVDSAVRLINETGGRIKMTDLCEQLSTPHRTLARNFKHITGFAPKFYTRVVQMHATLASMHADRDLSLSALANDHGYFDQAHFNKAVHEFFGFPPQEYRDLDAPAFRQYMGQKLSWPESDEN